MFPISRMTRCCSWVAAGLERPEASCWSKRGAKDFREPRIIRDTPAATPTACARPPHDRAVAQERRTLTRDAGQSPLPPPTPPNLDPLRYPPLPEPIAAALPSSGAYRRRRGANASVAGPSCRRAFHPTSPTALPPDAPTSERAPPHSVGRLTTPGPSSFPRESSAAGGDWSLRTLLRRWGFAPHGALPPALPPSRQSCSFTHG